MTEKPKRALVFGGGARYERWSATHTRLVFRDGSTVPASPQDDVQYEADAIADGFGRDTARMSRWHDFSHLYVAQVLNERKVAHSPTLHAVAHGTLDDLPSWLVSGEEALARAFAAYCVKGEARPELAALILAGADLDDLKANALRVLEGYR